MKLFRVLCIFLSLIFYLSASANEPRDNTLMEQRKEGDRLITIPEGISLVLKDSRLVKISFSDQNMAYQDTLIARSALLPQMTASFEQTFLQNQPAAKLGSQTVNTSERQYYSYGLDVYQTLFDFGKTIYNYRASKKTFDAQKENLERIKKLAVLEFVIAYFNLLEAEKMIMVAEKEVDSLTAYLYDVEHLYEQGAATRNDLLPAKVRLSDAKQKLIVARNLRATAAAKLNTILALPIREKVLVQDVDMTIPAVVDIEEAWRIAQTQRPEIKIITDQIDASVLTEKADRAKNYPTVFADGGYSYTKNEYQAHQDNTSLNLGANIKFFDGWSAGSEALKERYRQKRLSEQRDKLIEDIKFEIEDSHLGLRDAREKVLVAMDALSQAEENVRVNRIKYTEGSATTTDVLEAITMLTGAQTNYYSADYELKRNYAKLMYSMGIDLALIYDRMKPNSLNPASPK